jgi:putative membrane protein
MTPERPARPPGPAPAPRRRLHPAAIGAQALDALRQAALPIVVVVLVGGGLEGAIERGLLYALAGGALSVLVAYAIWSSTTWWIDEGEVGRRSGILSETVTTIPLQRVQAVDTVRGPVQRLFGVVELRVQAAGGGRRAEIVLTAVTPAAAEELREAVRRAGGGAGRGTGLAPDAGGVRATPASGPAPAVEPAPEPAPAEAPPPASAPDGGRPAASPPAAAWRLGWRGLVACALTSGSFGVLVPIVAGATQVADDVLGTRDPRALLPDTAGEAALLAAAVVVAAWLFSVLGTLVAFAGFVAVRDGDRLRIRRGLVEQREASVPVGRVHAVRVVESPLREPFGLAAIRIETAGYAREPASAQTLVPLVRRREAPAVIARLLPELAVPLNDLEPLPGRALRRHVVPPVAAALAATAGAALAAGPPGLLALVLVPAAAAHGVARHRSAGVALREGRVVLRRRGLALVTAVADARRLQAVTTQATPFQRRGRLATLAVSVSSGRRLAVAHLDAAAARRLQGRLAADAAGSMSTHTPGGLAGAAG